MKMFENKYNPLQILTAAVLNSISLARRRFALFEEARRPSDHYLQLVACCSLVESREAGVDQQSADLLAPQWRVDQFDSFQCECIAKR